MIVRPDKIVVAIGKADDLNDMSEEFLTLLQFTDQNDQDHPNKRKWASSYQQFVGTLAFLVVAALVRAMLGTILLDGVKSFLNR